MFERVPTGRWIAVAIALLCRLLVVSQEDAPPKPDWYYGEIVPNSLQKTANVYRFRLHSYASTNSRRDFEVIYTGDLPASVCAGEDTFLEGYVHDNIINAISVNGPGCTKGRDCRQWACLPVDERPPQCRSPARPVFE